MASGQRIAVIGATGAVGQTTLKILEQRKFPIRELRAYASARSAGTTVTFAGESLKVEKLDANSFKGIDIVLFSAGSEQSREFAPIAVKAGAIVIDKSNAFRMDPDVPLVVPEINPDAARRHKGILACPNCTTIVTVMPLKPLHDLGHLKRVVATSFQAVSGAGVNGVAELREQTMAWSKGEAIKSKFFQHPLTAQIADFADHGAGAGLHRAFDFRQRRDRDENRGGRRAQSVRGFSGDPAVRRSRAESLPDADSRRGAGRLLRRANPRGPELPQRA
jgi:aspartate-semialdehyde dehydrogenase